jgi:cytochrome c5
MKRTIILNINTICVCMLLWACSESSKQDPALAAGKAIVEKTCIACHGQGLNGAPILGNKKMWGKRLNQGEELLVSHAINGFAMEMMPPKGGNPDLTDEEVRLAVRYMMSLVTP